MQIIRFLLAFLTLLLIWYCFNLFQVYQFSKQYSEQQSDVAIVLGAGSKDGEVSPVFQERLNHAIYLLKNKKVNTLIITGGYGEGNVFSDSFAGKRYLIKNGVTEDQILIEEESEITFFNLVNAKQIMDKYRFKNALIVSDAYHMKRAMAMSKKIGIDAKSSPTQTSMYRSRKVKRKFLLNQAFQYSIYQIYGRFRKTS